MITQEMVVFVEIRVAVLQFAELRPVMGDELMQAFVIDEILHRFPRNVHGIQNAIYLDMVGGRHIFRIVALIPAPRPCDGRAAVTFA